ncbi:hypothetical protein V6N12_065140 [Hibiscus sabdariffa]|uniref:DUF668 domain-containing protein n=1 Tax=Hibiscus sabdariffa TaxID=183260 RepID=A0ABR2G7T9_9ROSI
MGSSPLGFLKLNIDEAINAHDKVGEIRGYLKTMLAWLLTGSKHLPHPPQWYCEPFDFIDNVLQVDSLHHISRTRNIETDSLAKVGIGVYGHSKELSSVMGSGVDEASKCFLNFPQQENGSMSGPQKGHVGASGSRTKEVSSDVIKAKKD